MNVSLKFPEGYEICEAIRRILDSRFNSSAGLLSCFTIVEIHMGEEAIDRWLRRT